MTPALIAAAVQLADTLAEENRALAALDLTRAAIMLETKTRALEVFKAAQILAARVDPASVDADQRSAAEQLAAKLRDLADENRRLLEHAMAVQGRVIGMVARATPIAETTAGGRYAAGGGPARTTIRSATTLRIGA